MNALTVLGIVVAALTPVGATIAFFFSLDKRLAVVEVQLKLFVDTVGKLERIIERMGSAS